AAPLIAVLDEAVEAGELPAGTDTRALADALAGPVPLRRLLHRPCVCPDEIPALVDQILPTPGPTRPPIPQGHPCPRPVPPPARAPARRRRPPVAPVRLRRRAACEPPGRRGRRAAREPPTGSGR